MLDHASIPVADLNRSAAFYDAVLAGLGYERRKQREGAIGYGPRVRRAPVFCILSRDALGALDAPDAPDTRGPADTARAGVGLHISFEAPDRASVDTFHSVALSSGGVDAGPPGERPHYTQPFYGAFVLDPDGFKIEAVCRKG